MSAIEAKQLPCCDVLWIVDHVAKGSYGVTFTDRAVQQQMENAKVLLDEMFEANAEFNLAHSDLRQAERDQAVPRSRLPFEHPAAVRFRAAADRRARVTARSMGIQS